jgi:two-component system, chemotaxis family, protein-glutamate methylesterase/glutaminase
MKPLRILVVDDTIVYRKIVSDVLSGLPDVEVVGTANNGKIALSRIDSLEPDLLTLDIEMPEMDGLEVLERMRREWPHIGAIILSGFTPKGGDMTVKALELGAFDFILKPQGGTQEENRKAIAAALAPMLRSFARQKEIRALLKRRTSPPAGTAPSADTAGPTGVVERMRAIAGQRKSRVEIVGIGVSTGGPSALAQVIPQLLPDLGVPVLVVQHMPPVFTESLARSLNAKCLLEVREAADGDPVVPNNVLIAPGGRHMKVVAGSEGKSRIIRITDDPPENSCRPSVDYLFRSISQLYGGRATGVIMTGMGCDGVLGLKLMKRTGCTVIAQDEATSVVFGMPKEAIEAGVADVIAPLDKIAEEIRRTVKA